MHPFEALCRDPLTGLHHATFKRLYGGSGNPGNVVHMYYDPERGTLVDGLVEVAHAEWYEDGVMRRRQSSSRAGSSWKSAKSST